jgi:hypothetical protein
MHPSVVKAVEYAAMLNHDVLEVPFRHRIRFEWSGGIYNRMTTLYLRTTDVKPFVLLSWDAGRYPAVLYKKDKWIIGDSHGVPF